LFIQLLNFLMPSTGSSISPKCSVVPPPIPPGLNTVTFKQLIDLKLIGLHGDTGLPIIVFVEINVMDLSCIKWSYEYKSCFYTLRFYIGANCGD
jgi:hypothetical protein